MNKNIITNFNKLIIQLQNSLNDIDDNTQANQIKFKIRNFQKVVRILLNYDNEITDSSQVKDIKGIGVGTLKRIDEILETGTLSEINLEQSSNNNSSQSKGKILKDLQRITGIGPVKAKKLFEKEITLDKILDLYQVDKDNELFENFTHHQMIGIEYFHDIESRISYSEIKHIQQYLQNIIKNIDKLLDFEICGSFRRQKKDSGDIDILITHKNIITDSQIKKMDLNYLKDLIELLKHENFIKADLTYNGDTKYMGMCKFKDNPCRRIDIRFIPKEALGAALLYFTGSGEFNKNMRTFAITKGYTINEYGIYKLDKDKKTKKEKINTITEEDIFNVLDLEYIDPKDRTALVKF